MRVALFWTVCAGFFIGVCARSVFVFGWWTILFFLTCAIGILITTRIANSAKRPALIAAVLLVSFAAGAARMQVSVFRGDLALDVWIGERVEILGVVVDEPDKRENNVRIPVRVESVASTSIDRDVRVLIVAPLHADVVYGDRISAKGELNVPKAFETGEGREFNYPGFLAKDGIGYELSFATTQKIDTARRNPLKVAAIWIKQSYLDGLAMALPEPAAGLAGGITAGDKRGLGSDLSETFRVVGLVHIVVLSGYNIMVVIGFLERILKSARLWIRSSLAVSVAIFFALITGLASSSVRAASMAVIATVGKATGRTYLASRALALVALAMVVWNPFVLLFDPGFQLSIIATLGLIYITPLVAEKLAWLTEKFGLREIAAATLGTQIAVLPLILYQSGSLSVYSLPANLLALIVVPFAMLLSFIAGVVGIVAGPIASVVGFPAFVLLEYVIHIAELFASLPFSAVTVPAFSAFWLVVVYGILFLVFLWLEQKERRSPLAAPRVEEV